MGIFYHDKKGEICDNQASVAHVLCDALLFSEIRFMVLYASYSSPFGTIEIGHEDGIIVAIRRSCQPLHHNPSTVSDLANMQLQEYFAGKRQAFDLPIEPRGTPFQKAVWSCLLQIPYGEVRSYGQIAAAMGKPKACRAVGMACNRNPLWIVIPCHRVVGSNNALTGYAGGLDMKQRLLALEQHP